MKCDSSLTFKVRPRRLSSEATIAWFLATPPVKETWSSTPTRRSRPTERAAIDWWTPSRMSSIFLPLPSQERTSDSANTVQVVLILTGRSPRNAVGPI